MTKIQYQAKQKHLNQLRKDYKDHVIHDDSAKKIHNIKDLIESVEKELKSYENNI